MTRTIPVAGDVSPEAVTAIVDALLLSLIRAHPNDAKGRDTYRRLNEAKSALFGIKAQRGRRPDDDLPELMHMADAYIAEHGKPEIGADYTPQWPDGCGDFCRPAQTLARAAIRARQRAEPGYAPHSEEKMRNLQQKFSRNIGEWLKLSHGQDGLPETVFRLKVRELAELLEPLGIAVKTPSEPLRDINSPN
jgi:hypothetical protein